MPDIPFYHQAIAELASGLTFQIKGNDYSTLVSRNGVALPSESDIDAKVIELEAAYNAQEYARNRQNEYPSIAELTVALYDTDDKSAVEAKRAAVKAKYPKPE